jgi:hypothetical protein
MSMQPTPQVFWPRDWQERGVPWRRRRWRESWFARVDVKRRERGRRRVGKYIFSGTKDLLGRVRYDLGM